jgi:hypothetical protein
MLPAPLSARRASQTTVLDGRDLVAVSTLPWVVGTAAMAIATTAMPLTSALISFRVDAN